MMETTVGHIVTIVDADLIEPPRMETPSKSG